MTERVLTEIRTFKIEDIDRIVEIEEEALPKSAYSKETLISYARKYADSFFVVEAGGAVGGYILFDMNGHIHSTAVSRKQRRKGFGKMLFAHALKITKTRPWLEVRSKNVAAIEFYKKLGMKTVGRIPDYYETDDALVMVLDGSQGSCDRDCGKSTEEVLPWK